MGPGAATEEHGQLHLTSRLDPGALLRSTEKALHKLNKGPRRRLAPDARPFSCAPEETLEQLRQRQRGCLPADASSLNTAARERPDPIANLLCACAREAARRADLLSAHRPGCLPASRGLR